MSPVNKLVEVEMREREGDRREEYYGAEGNGGIILWGRGEGGDERG